MEQPTTSDLMIITEEDNNDDVISISSSSSESSSNNTNNNNNNINDDNNINIIDDDEDPEQQDINQRKLIYQEKLATLIDAKLEELAKSSGKVKETFNRFCQVLSAGRLKAGHFACGGQFNDSMNFPGIEIHGYEDNEEKSSSLLPLPLVSKDYFENHLKMKSEEGCPYYAYQFPNHTVQNKNWIRMRDELVDKDVRYQLGINDSINLVMKQCTIMIQDENSVDSTPYTEEDDDSMFCSLIIQLPSDFETEDPDITVEYKGNVEKFNFSKDATFKSYYLANYLDCKVTIPKITRGYRVFMVCYLASDVYTPPTTDNSLLVKSLHLVVDQFQKDTNIVRVLEEEYRGDVLSFSNLRGKDKILVTALKQYEEKFKNIGIFLVNLQKEEERYEDDSNTPDYYITRALRKDKSSVTRFKISEGYISPDEDVFENVKSVSKEIDKFDHIWQDIYDEVWAVVICSKNKMMGLAINFGKDIALEYLGELWEEYDKDSNNTALLKKITKSMQMIIDKYGDMPIDYLKRANNIELVKKILSSSKNKMNIHDLIELERHLGEKFTPTIQQYLKTLDIASVFKFLSGNISFKMKEDVLKYKFQELHKVPSNSIKLDLELFMFVYTNSEINLDFWELQAIISKIKADIDILLLKGLEHDYIHYIVVALRRCWTLETVYVEKTIQCATFLHERDYTNLFKYLIDEFCKRVDKSTKLNLIMQLGSYLAKDEKEKTILEFILNKVLDQLLKENFQLYDIEDLVSVFETCASYGRKAELQEIINRLTADNFAVGYWFKNSQPTEMSYFSSQRIEKIEIPLGGKSHYHHIIIPMILKLETTKEPVIQDLIKTCLNYCNDILDGKEKVPSPISWNIGAQVNCNCGTCKDVLEFVNSPTLISKLLQINQPIKDHIMRNYAAYKCLTYEKGQSRLTIRKSLTSPHLNHLTLAECKFHKAKLEELIIKEVENVNTKKRDDCDTETEYDTESPTKKIKM